MTWAVVLCSAFASAQEPSAKVKARVEEYKQGHSPHGEAFDSGPRARPWEIKEIGSAHFPITTKNPEVQKWFDQGNALLHSFWDYEAERAFRWCLKLEPENAMVYWGLARATSDERSADFIREAVKRKAAVSERERLYIEALEARTTTSALRDRGDDGFKERNRKYKNILESLCLKYPDDMEARALLAYANMGDSRYGTELMVREILAKQPDHPGAHHYRIHNWNYHEPEQALASCRRYGQIATGIGHALHMPGHVYSTVGMWHEAAISMDSATRVEKRYMQERLTFPFNNWNYGHNRAYLSYIQEQLGMADAAIFGARQLLDAPLDPERNSDNPYSSHSQGMSAMLRALIKFERWRNLLDEKSIPWRDLFHDQMWKAYARTRGHLGLGDLTKAAKSLEEHAKLRSQLDKNKDLESLYELQANELRARLTIARGDTLVGLAQLAEAAHKQFEMQESDNDPPRYPEVLYVSLGRAYLAANSAALSAASFEKALELTRNDAFALAGLVEARAALGETAKAEEAMARLAHVLSDADRGLGLLERAKATRVKVGAPGGLLASEQRYARQPLERFGPSAWQAYAAPELKALDAESKPITLADMRGKNVILVFYLGRECPHCVQQLRDLNNKKADWERLETVVIAVSGNPPEANARYTKDLAMPGVRLLSDRNGENARRFQSYDDFEEMEIHSTILIDKLGRVHWARNGGAPFTDMGFLVKQLERMNGAAAESTKAD